LFDTIAPIDLCVEKLPEAKKKEFVDFYLVKLPLNFEEEIYTIEQLAILKKLIESFESKSQIAMYVGASEGSLEGMERAIDLFVKNNWVGKDKIILKKMVTLFSKVISAKPQLWPIYQDSFVEKYLS